MVVSGAASFASAAGRMVASGASMAAQFAAQVGEMIARGGGGGGVDRRARR
ncbi:MAG: hypothetical protein ACYCUG_06110 [Acidimicrobiales bacterium]